MSRLLSFFALCAVAPLLAAPARAQVIATSQMTDSAFAASDCNSDEPMQVTFSYTGTPGFTSQYTIFTSDISTAGQELTACNNQPAAGSALVESQTLPLDNLVEIPSDHDIRIKDFLAGVCDGSPRRGDRMLCMRVTDGITMYGTGGGVLFTVDTEVPAAPTSASWQGGDEAVVLTAVEAGGGVQSDETLTFLVELRPCMGSTLSGMDAGAMRDASDATARVDTGPEDVLPEDTLFLDGSIVDTGVADIASAHASDATATNAASDGGNASESACGATASYVQRASSAQLPLTVGGLQNGMRYEVRLRLRDGAGNTSDPGPSAVITAQPEFGFWDVYQGAETGFGCTSCAQQSDGGAGLWLLFGLAVGLVLWRRRRLLPVLGLCLLATTARADFLSLGVHLGGGPYKPLIDSEPGANGVYRCVFDDKSWLLSNFGADVVLFDLVGTLSLGAELSYFTIGGRERSALPSDQSCGPVSSSTNTLHMLPLGLNLHYRFDWPYKTFGFPLAPYARVGVNATPWAITRNGVLDKTGGSLTGLRTGWQWALGVALVLDFFDEAHMHMVREDGFFQHAYLYAEWRDQRIDSFGQPGFELGNSTWMAGIALDI